MAEYRIEAEEVIRSVYSVEADSEQEARAKIENLKASDWDGVDMVFYTGISVDIQKVEEKNER